MSTKKKRSKFYTIYFSVIIIFVIALIAGSIVFFNWLRSYEQSQPLTLVNSLISDYIKLGKYDQLRRDFEIELSEYETEEHFFALLHENIDNKKITISHSSIKPEGIDEAYIIKADDVKVLNVFLKKHKIDDGYDVDSIEVSKNLLKTIIINVYQDTKITINGKEVPDNLRVDTEIPELPKVDASKLSPPQTITIKGLYSETQEIEAQDNGSNVKVTNNGGTYNIAQAINQAIASHVKETAQNASIAYAAYMQKDGPITELAKYTDTSTPFYESVSSSNNQSVNKHNGYKNDDIKVSSLIKYSDSLYSCHVSFNHTLILANTTYPDNFDKIVYVLKNGESYKVIDMQNPQSEK